MTIKAALLLFIVLILSGCNPSNNTEESQQTVVQLNQTKSSVNANSTPESNIPDSFKFTENSEKPANNQLINFGLLNNQNSGNPKDMNQKQFIQEIDNLINSQQWQAASRKLQQHVIEHPEDKESFKTLCIVMLNAGEMHKALPYLDKAIKLNPDDADLYFYRAIIKNNLNDFPEALSDFKKAEELGCKQLHLPLNICMLLLNINEIEQAEARAQEMLEHRKSVENRIPELILGYVALQKKDINTAKKYYDLCKEDLNCPPDLIKNLGLAVERMSTP